MADLACIICGGAGGREVWHERGIAVVHCLREDCIYTRQVSELTDDYFTDQPPDLSSPGWVKYWRDGRLGYWRKTLDFLRKNVTVERPRLLDVGGGAGFFSKEAIARGWRVTLVEPSRYACDLARRELDLPDVVCGLLEDAQLEEGCFDVIVLGCVVAHVPNPTAFLERCRQLLKPRTGILYVKTPNISFHLPYARALKRLRPRASDRYLVPDEHPWQFSRATLVELLHEAGFGSVRFVWLGIEDRVTDTRSGLIPQAKVVCNRLAWALYNISFRKLLFTNQLTCVTTAQPLPSDDTRS